MYPQATYSDGPYSPVPDALPPGIGDGSVEYLDFASAMPVAVPEAVENPPAGLSSSSCSTTILAGDGSLNLPNCTSDQIESLNFSDLNLTCPIDVDEITTRWIRPYIPGPGEKIKSYPVNIISFIFRMLNSYAAATTRDRGLVPFIHPSQMKQQPSSSPLTTCLSLVRMCQNPLPGSENAGAVIIQREMENITEHRESYDDMSLLAAFQAYLIYAMVLVFRLSQARNNHLRQAMINLQELAHASSRRGLVCAADQSRVRPRWEEWIVTEAKRRTLYVMYLFDSILSAQEGLPTYLGTELQGLPAPATKSLWQAQARSGWEREYNIYLAEWMEHGLTIDELWPIPTDLDESGIVKRRSRVDHWLEDIDDFGTMLYAVMSCTHGG